MVYFSIHERKVLVAPSNRRESFRFQQRVHCSERVLGHLLAALIMFRQVDSLRFCLSVSAKQNEVWVVAFLENDA